MSALGKRTRLNRIFSHPCGRVLTVAVDHLINYPENMPAGLRFIERTVEEIVAGRPDAITMNKGIALRVMPRFAGQVPFIIQSLAPKADRSEFAVSASVAEVAAMGADAIALAMFVKGAGELAFITHLGSVVREAERYGLPVITHIYPLSSGDEQRVVTHEPEDIFYAVRMGLEMGADVIKVPYTGDVASFRDIVSVTPAPIVTAGGPKCDTLEDAERMVEEVVESGAAGCTIGRNVWGFPDIPEAVRRLKKAAYGGRPG
ncbi:MAG: aldolase [Nitrospiraceae bacterium]|nr:aldolase [Nitrospiraceae bacterium]